MSQGYGSQATSSLFDIPGCDLAEQTLVQIPPSNGNQCLDIVADLKRVELVVKLHLLHDPVVGYQLAAGRYPRERVYQVCVPEGVHVYLVRALGVARRVPVLRPRLVVPHVDRVGRRGTV